VLGDVIPFIGDIVRAGTGLIGLLLTAVLAPIVIAVGWLFYRPVVAVGILVIGGIVAYAALRIARQRKQRQVAAA
jgi:hypothetical protein